MKYANIKLDQGCISSFCCDRDMDRVVNIGDHIQLLAIEHLYELMEIPKDEIIEIEYYDLMDYDGEYVVLPINLILFNPYYGEKILRFSPKIIPVFLGISYDNLNPPKEELEYFRTFQPIGCRDEYTMNLFRKFGITAYLNGCLSASLTRREESVKGNKVYFVDVPESLVEYIPEQLKESSVFVSQQYYGKFGGTIKDTSLKEFSRKQFEQYRENAALVVTSRLHCASPCMAMGIPVIFTVDKYLHSYGWLEKLIPVYVRDEFRNINWQPHPIDCEEIKQRMINLAIQRILKARAEYEDIYALSAFYEKRVKKQFEHSQIAYLKKHSEKYWNKSDTIQYAIWGVTMVSAIVLEYMEREYPNSKLIAVFDDYRDFVYNGYQTIKTNKIKDYEHCCIIATGDSSSIAAKELFEQTKRPLSDYCLCFQSGYQTKVSGEFEN